MMNVTWIVAISKALGCIDIICSRYCNQLNYNHSEKTVLVVHNFWWNISILEQKLHPESTSTWINTHKCENRFRRTKLATSILNKTIFKTNSSLKSSQITNQYQTELQNNNRNSSRITANSATLRFIKLMDTARAKVIFDERRIPVIGPPSSLCLQICPTAPRPAYIHRPPERGKTRRLIPTIPVESCASWMEARGKKRVHTGKMGGRGEGGLGGEQWGQKSPYRDVHARRGLKGTWSCATKRSTIKRGRARAE